MMFLDLHCLCIPIPLSRSVIYVPFVVGGLEIVAQLRVLDIGFVFDLSSSGVQGSEDQWTSFRVCRACSAEKRSSV